jgi:hypothetical protein
VTSPSSGETIAANVVPVAGSVILIVPPVHRVPDGAIVPPAPYLLGAKDTGTGQLRCGVLGVHVDAAIGPGQVEVGVVLHEIAQPDGSPAVTPGQVRDAIVLGDPARPWPQGVATVRSTFRVDGFELGQLQSAFFDPQRFQSDVRAVRDALGAGGEDGG